MMAVLYSCLYKMLQGKQLSIVPGNVVTAADNNPSRSPGSGQHNFPIGATGFHEQISLQRHPVVIRTALPATPARKGHVRLREYCSTAWKQNHFHRHV